MPEKGHFHVRASGTSTQSVVISMSTIAGVHIILVRKMSGSQSSYEILPLYFF